MNIHFRWNHDYMEDFVRNREWSEYFLKIRFDVVGLKSKESIVKMRIFLIESSSKINNEKLRKMWISFTFSQK